ASPERHTASLHDALPSFERHTSFAERLLHGFREQVERSGVTGLVELTPPTHAGALAAVEALRGASEPPTALVVHNEAALPWVVRSEEHTSELQSRENLVC